MDIVGLSGSLRATSSNTMLLLAAEKLSGGQVLVTDLVGQLPLFTPDLDPNEVPSVLKWTELMRSCQGVIISTPEYARGYPGALKNALDWLVQGDGFVAKPFTLLKASPRATISQTTLATVLTTMSGVHIKNADTMVPLLGRKLQVDDILCEYGEVISRCLRTFVEEIKVEEFKQLL